jgi:hypothetical protein
MGTTARAELAYGYDLGGMEGFKAAEVGRYDGPDLPWWAEEDEHPEEFTEVADRMLLDRIGRFAETDRRADGYYDRKHAAEKRVGVRFDFPGNVEYPGLVLIAEGSRRAVAWAEVMTLDPNEILIARPDWDAKLAAALDALGIHPTQPGPRWLVYPTYG